jgi:MFS family permease
MSEMLDPGTNVEKEPAAPDASVTSTPIGKVGPFASLRIRNFRFLLAGSLLFSVAGCIQGLGLNWLVYKMTGSGTILGSINMVLSATSLVMIPMSGVLVDRVDHRKLMFLKNIWMFAIVLGLGFLLLSGHPNISYLFAFALLCGVIQTLNITLGQVVIFDLVPRIHTPNAIALLQTGGYLTRSFVPVIGGLLIIWFGPGGNFLFEAGVFVLIILTVTQLHFPAQKPSLVRTSSFQNIQEGIKYVAKQRVTRTFVLLGFILALFTVPIIVVLPPIYAVKVFHGGADVLGILISSFGAGGIFGGVATAYVSRLDRWGLVQLVSIFMLSLCLMAFAFATKLWIALLFLSLGGFFEAISLSTNQTLLQLSIPNDLRGRVTSVVNLNAALSLVGCLLAGVGADVLGGPKMITVILAGAAAGICILVFMFSPTVRNYRLSQGIASNAAKKTGE